MEKIWTGYLVLELGVSKLFQASKPVFLYPFARWLASFVRSPEHTILYCSTPEFQQYGGCWSYFQ